MHIPGNQRFGFGRLNSILGSNNSNNCQYVWDEASVALKNPYFDEKMYREAKLADRIDIESCMTVEQKKEVIDKVFSENEQLIMDISYAGPAEWKQLDSQLTFLLDGAFTLAEHKAQLQISMSNIQQTRSVNDGWMSCHDMETLLSLTQKRKFTTSESAKFIGTRN